MNKYNYVLNAPFESDKFFEKIEQDMNDNKIILIEHPSGVVAAMIKVKLNIDQYLDTLYSKYYTNMDVHNISQLVGYVETLFASSGSYISSELMNLYIEYVIYRYLTTSVRVHNSKVKNESDKLMTNTIVKINNIINS
jgi:hypothetical protein